MVWTIGGWVVFAGALGLGLWALLGDRSRGRKRCPKCWYDMNAAAPDTRGRWVCSECGKAVERERLLKRTRRRWRWVGVVMLLIGVSHGLRAVPDVRQKGWIEAVPDTALVVSYVFLSEEPGSGLPWVLPNKQGGRYEQGVLRRVGREYWSREDREQRFSWLSRRLAFLIARTQSTAKLTDGTTAKGKAFKSTLTQIVRSGGAYGFESRWAHSVAHVEFEGPGRVAPGERLYASPRVRRLLLGTYRIQLSRYHDVLEGSTPSSMWINGAGPQGTASQVEAQWIERFRWDRLRRVQPLDPVWNEGAVLAMPRHAPQADGAFEQDIEFAVTEDVALRGESEQWRRVAKFGATLTGLVDHSLAPAVDSSVELRDELQSRLRARLVPVYHKAKDLWVLAIRLRPRLSGQGPPVGERLIFGGQCGVVVEWHFEDGPHELTELWGSETLWLWDTPDPGTKENPFPELGAELLPHRGSFARGQGEVAGGVSAGGSPPALYKNYSATVHAVIRGLRMASMNDLSGLRADTIYDGELRFRLRWTPEELRRFVYMGEIPDHAMR